MRLTTSGVGLLIWATTACGPTTSGPSRDDTGGAHSSGETATSRDVATASDPGNGATDDAVESTGDDPALDTTASTGGDVSSDGDTDTGEPNGSINCHPGDVRCDAAPPHCQPGEVPAVENGCWGDCVSILECATIVDCADCSNGFCAGYVGETIEYRCVLPPLECAALACSCVAPYFCVDPYDACQVDPGNSPSVICECRSC